MKKGLFFLASALVLTSLAFKVKPTNYVVDASKSTINWYAKKVTGAHNGTINLSSGSLVVEGNELKSGVFEIDTRSIVVKDIKDEKTNKKLHTHLSSDDFFGVEKYPTARLEILSATSKGSGNYDIQGNLTIKGKTNPITFPATVTIDGNTLNAKSKITVDRTKYDIRYGSKSFFDNLGDKAIYDDFDLEVDLVATQQ